MKDAASAFTRDNKISAGRSVRKWLCSTALVVLAGATPSMVHAEEWTGAVSTDWNTAANWQGGAVPAGSDVHIDNEGTGWPIITGGTHSIGTVTVGGPGGSGALTLNAGTLSAQKLVLAAAGAGSSASVAINAQSSVDIAGTVEIASASGSTGTMAVSGTDALLTIGGTLGVGHIGDGTLLIENGGKTIVNNTVRIGFGSDATGAVTVRGAGSQLETSNSLRVGFEGNGSLTVENGGHVLSNGGTLALGAGSTGTALVTGSGSLWDARGVNAFQVGGQGNAASLTVTDGALLQASKVHVGGFSGASSNVMTVSGGARVESLDAFVGGAVGQSGTVLVTGAGTEWAATGNFTVGGAADGSMTLADGGVLNSQGGAIGGASAGNTGTGEVLVTGAGSIWNVGDPNTYELRVGDAGAGLLRVENGGVVNGRVQIGQHGELSGNGTITGNTILTGTGKLWGTQGETLTFGGDLHINSAASNINVALGTPDNGTGLFNVTGDLTLDGTLNVSNAGGFGEGVYRIFDYGGTLTDNGLDVGTMPSGTSGTVQTAVAHQVNLLVSGAAGDTQFWNGTTMTADGTVHGGAGIWSAGPTTNWTDANGMAAAAWNGQFAVFQNNPAAVTVDGSAGAVVTTGMQFIGTGWTVGGDAITLDGADGNTTVRVGDGTGAGASHTATIASELAGNSRLVKDDLGTLILAGANTYSGGTQVNNGVLQIGNGGTSGSITGDVLNNAVLAFDRSDATTFAGTITGSGAVRLMNGDLTLTADNTYTGLTNIAAGATLRLGNGGTSGGIVGDVDTAGTLVFNRSNSFDVAGVISGTGVIRQVGSGLTNLTGNSGAFTGTTRVENGTLAVNGTLGGSVEILGDGRLQGAGTVGNTIVSSVIAPGNSIGTLNVAGDITFNAGSIYEVEVNAAGQSDRIAAAGTAAINGGSVQVLAGIGAYAPATTYTILTADGLSDDDPQRHQLPERRHHPEPDRHRRRGREPRPRQFRP